jgi:hypothetical protein
METLLGVGIVPIIEARARRAHPTNVSPDT